MKSPGVKFFPQLCATLFRKTSRAPVPKNGINEDFLHLKSVLVLLNVNSRSAHGDNHSKLHNEERFMQWFVKSFVPSLRFLVSRFNKVIHPVLSKLKNAGHLLENCKWFIEAAVLISKAQLGFVLFIAKKLH